jgi:hypothetical protein
MIDYLLDNLEDTMLTYGFMLKVEEIYVDDTIDKFLDYTVEAVKNFCVASCPRILDDAYNYDHESTEPSPPPIDSHSTG